MKVCIGKVGRMKVMKGKQEDLECRPKEGKAGLIKVKKGRPKHVWKVRKGSKATTVIKWWILQTCSGESLTSGGSSL